MNGVQNVEREERSSDRLPYIFIGVLFIIRIILLFFIKDIIDFDEIPHYIMARDAIKYPLNYICPFVKPGFTLPVSFLIFITNDILGIHLLRVFNVVCSTIALIYVYKTLKLYNLKMDMIIAGMTFFSFGQFNFLYYQSGVTEPLAVCLVVIGYYYFRIEKNNLSSIIFSYSFLVRNETILIISVLGLFYFFSKKKIVPIVIFASIPLIWVFSFILAGINPFVLLTYNQSNIQFQIPLYVYVPFRHNITGLFVFFKSLVNFFGIVQFIFFVIGFISLFYRPKDELFYSVIVIYIFLALSAPFIVGQAIHVVRYTTTASPLNYIVFIYGLKNFKGFAEKGFMTYSLKNKRYFKIEELRRQAKQKSEVFTKLLVIAMILNTAIFMGSRLATEYSPEHQFQIEIGVFLKNKYDMPNKRVFCPLGIDILYAYVTRPAVYVLNYNNSYNPDDSTAILNLEGFFYDNIERVNLETYIKPGNILIWSSEYPVPFLNPFSNKSDGFIHVKTFVGDKTIAIYEKI